MTEGKSDDQLFRGAWYCYGDRMMKNSDDFQKSAGSSFEDSMVSNGSSSISSVDDTTDDASSSGSLSNSNGSLDDFSEIMAQLPIKRGLSEFYHGKSESFTSLSTVTSVEDLAKKTSPYSRKGLKASKNCGNGVNRYKPYTLPSSVAAKKVGFPSRRAAFY